MTATDDTTRRRVHAPGECVACGAPMAHDQRYCLHCGLRRGPMPEGVLAMLRDLRARSSPPTPPFLAAPGDDDPEEVSRPFVPTPRVASLVVMAMLSFGVVAGSLTTPGGAESLARTLVVSLAPPAQSTPSPTAAAGNGSSGAGGGNAAPQAAITETITESATTPAAGTGSGAPAASPGSGSGTGTGTGTGSSNSLLGLPPVKHVFVIMLSGQGYDQAFGTSTGHTYLSSTLRKQGELIPSYYGVAQSPLANGIALISGQGPTAQTAADCPQFLPIDPSGTGAYSQLLGTGCVYPKQAKTLPGELAAKKLPWRAYIQGSTNAASGDPATCRHPVLDGNDANQAAIPGDPYVTWRNPFVYFQSIEASAACAKDDVDLGRLKTDLRKLSTTPSLSYIAPDPCDDGSDEPCTTGAPAGLAEADKFLKSVVPAIEKSPAYKKDGMIVVTFDQAPQSGAGADSSSCCDQPTFPNLATSESAALATDTITTDTSSTAGETDTNATDGETDTNSTTSTTSAYTTSTTSTETASTPTTTASVSATVAPPSTTTVTAQPTATSTTTSSTTTTAAPTTTTSTTSTTSSTGTPPGGGQVGALLISQYVKAGSEDAAGTFNHFSLLKTIEDLFGVKHLGYSADKSLPEFDASVFNASQS